MFLFIVIGAVHQFITYQWLRPLPGPKRRYIVKGSNHIGTGVSEIFRYTHKQIDALEQKLQTQTLQLQTQTLQLQALEKDMLEQALVIDAQNMAMDQQKMALVVCVLVCAYMCVRVCAYMCVLMVRARVARMTDLAK